MHKALEGTTTTATDGWRNYDEIESRIERTVLETSNELKGNPKFKQLRKEAKELIAKQKKSKTKEQQKQIAEAFAQKRSEMSMYAKDTNTRS